ncbi:MAG: tetratricopeptide repeat protein, partial [Ginsengibacter sp.]
MSASFFRYFILLYLITGNVILLNGQSKGVNEIEKAITEKEYKKAEGILKPIIDSYSALGKADSLVTYIYYVGKISQGLSGVEESIKKMELFAGKIKKLSSNPATLRQIYIETGEYYGTLGLNDKGYHANQQALKYTLLMQEKTGNDLALVENNLSTYAQRMADLKLAQHYARTAIQHVLADKKPDYVTLYISYNAMGATMWYASKTDSALYYYQNALATLKKTEQNPLNKFYRTAILLNNLSGLYQLQGNVTGAIEALKTTITNLKDFIADKAPDPKKVNAVTLQYEATDNLAGIYKELGDLRKAKDLLEYSYEQKQKKLTESNPAIFISQILLGQIYFALRDYDRALVFLEKGLNKIEGSGVNYLFWQADACNTLALLYDTKKDVKQATYFYEKTDSLYEESLQGDYDNIYLDFLRNAALFYAEHHQSKIAVAKANKGYNYVVKAQGPHTLIAFYQLLNLSEVYFLSGNYREALDYSNKGLDVVNRNISTSH